MSNNSYVVLGDDGVEQILDADEILGAGKTATLTGTPATKIQQLLNGEFNALLQMIAVIEQQVNSKASSSTLIASLNNLKAEVNNCIGNLGQQLASSGVGSTVLKR